MEADGALGGTEAELQGLRQRADADFSAPDAGKVAGRHQREIAELGLRVSLTRARYPNTAAGSDQYAITISRTALDRQVADFEVRLVLAAAFGEAAVARVRERPAGALVRMFRLPA